MLMLAFTGTGTEGIQAFCNFSIKRYKTYRSILYEKTNDLLPAYTGKLAYQGTDK
jgi:hypothetical protein